MGGRERGRGGGSGNRVASLSRCWQWGAGKLALTPAAARCGAFMRECLMQRNACESRYRSRQACGTGSKKATHGST